jgi:hypothetical protein
MRTTITEEEKKEILAIRDVKLNYLKGLVNEDQVPLCDLDNYYDTISRTCDTINTIENNIMLINDALNCYLNKARKGGYLTDVGINGCLEIIQSLMYLIAGKENFFILSNFLYKKCKGLEDIDINAVDKFLEGQK